MIHTGDAIEVMRGMEADSVDAVVTDPPAGISFMSKHWDRDKGGRTEWVAWMTEVMGECYRVLKPGGYAVVWSLPRTCHWTAWAMEDAGFIIRDQLAHIFASGFPKGKAQLKPAREDWWLARKPGPLRPLGIEECRIGTGETLGRTNHTTSRFIDSANGSREPHPRTVTVDNSGGGRWPSNVLLSDPELFDEPNPYVVGSGATDVGGGNGRPIVAGDFGKAGIYGAAKGATTASYADSGGYSRFFKIPQGETDGEHRRGPAGEGASQERMERTSVSASGDVGIPGMGGTDSGTPSGDSPRDLEDGDYPSAFLIPKADRADREPVVRGESAVYCNCETVKPDRWVSEDRKPPERTASTSRRKATSEATTKDGSDSNTTLFGSSTSDPSPPETRSTTSTATSSTTESRTSSPSIPSPTNGSTPGASSSTASGGSDAPSAPSTGPSTPSGGTSPRKAGRSTGDADPATSPESLPIRRCDDCGELKPESGRPLEAVDGVARASRRNSHPT